MNEFNSHKSVATSMGVRCTAWFLMLMFANLPTLAFAQPSCSGIHVKILNISNSNGAIACALFQSPEGFPKDFLRFATNITIIKIQESQATCHFSDIPPGKYAMAVIHDENMNGNLDTNWMGAPKEGFGFSNNAEALLSNQCMSIGYFYFLTIIKHNDSVVKEVCL